MSDQFTIRELPPNYAGSYWVGGMAGGLRIDIRERPSWIHRFMMRWAFGWVWVDAPRKR